MGLPAANGVTQAQHVKKEEANAVVLYPGV
jgi:hypothetical protein